MTENPIKTGTYVRLPDNAIGKVIVSATSYNPGTETTSFSCAISRHPDSHATVSINNCIAYFYDGEMYEAEWYNNADLQIIGDNKA